MAVPYSTSAVEEGGWSAVCSWRLPSGKRLGDNVKFTLEQAVKAQRRSRGISLLFFNLCARWGWVVNATPRPLCSRERDRYPLYRRLDGPQGRPRRVWKITPPTGIRSPDCTACSESLYRLSYPGTHCNVLCYS